MKNDLSKYEIIEYLKEILKTKIKDIPNLYMFRDLAIPYTYIWSSKSTGIIQKKGVDTIFFSLSSRKDPDSDFRINFMYVNLLICVEGKVKASVDYMSIFDFYRLKDVMSFDNFENIRNKSILEIIKQCDDERRSPRI